MNFDLFSSSETYFKLDIANADCLIYRDFFNSNDADNYFQELLQSINWHQEVITMFGKQLNVPRLSALYGEPNLSYKYSGIRSFTLPWTPLLQAIKSRVELITDCTFNSVLINLYRDGNDSVDWHSDNEPELGIDPVIASVSLGEPRMFHLKSKMDKRINKSILLPHGSLLLMRGKTQTNMVHKISKSKKLTQARINLTYRYINVT